MSYKTILVHVDQSKHLEKRVRIAASIAIAENAHLVGVAATGISSFIRDTTIANPMDPAMGPALDKLRERANAALATYEAIVRKMGVTSYEKQVIDDAAADGVSLRARYCDLAVLGQEYPDEPSPALVSGFPEYVAMSSGSGTLIVPHAGDFDTLGERVLIAWNASSEALHAVRAALPLLRRAKNVDVVVYNAASRQEVYGEEPGADMLVMGCYGHSRFREMLLGGATRVILQSMTVPVLMAH